MNLLLNKVILGRQSAPFLEEMSQSEFRIETFCIEKIFIVSPLKSLLSLNAAHVCRDFLPLLKCPIIFFLSYIHIMYIYLSNVKSFLYFLAKSMHCSTFQ